MKKDRFLRWGANSGTAGHRTDVNGEVTRRHQFFAVFTEPLLNGELQFV